MTGFIALLFIGGLLLWAHCDDNFCENAAITFGFIMPVALAVLGLVLS